MYLVAEDSLSLTVGRRLITEQDALEVSIPVITRGNGAIRARISSYVKVAEKVPIMILTDLDQLTCASALMESWFGNLPVPKKMLFRVAVREVETWLMADTAAFSSFTGIPRNKLPARPEEVDDPKQLLLNVVSNYCRNKNLRLDITCKSPSGVRQGLGYNNRLENFVAERWTPEVAELKSESLKRARQRIAELASEI